MKSFVYVIKDKEGIHARPAGIIVAAAKKYQSNVTITNKGKTADLKRIFGLMSLCIKCNEEVKITCAGPDEATAVVELEEIFKNNI